MGKTKRHLALFEGRIVIGRESIIYTILFIRQGSKLLMLNRDRSPAQGLWNGVGGKLEAGETPLTGVLREAYEETGIRLLTADYKGIVCWESDRSPFGGMHVFTAEFPQHEVYPTPRRMDEGLLEWKEIDWIMEERNLGVGEIIPRYLPAVLQEDQRYIHHCVLERNKLIRYERKPLEPVFAG